MSTVDNYFSAIWSPDEKTVRSEQFCFANDDLDGAKAAQARANECAIAHGGRVAVWAPCSLPSARSLPVISTARLAWEIN